jgi:two-component system NtrC family sensor kinase
MAVPGEIGHRDRLRRLGSSLSAKLVVLLVSAMVIIFGLFGFLNIRLHRRHLESATVLSAERMSDVIKRGTSYHMMRNDREALYRMIRDMAAEPGVIRIRIINNQGKIAFSSNDAEVNTLVDKRAEACDACHATGQPREQLARTERSRVLRANGGRVMAVITPIENRPACANAECHAHPAQQRILGVLDTHVSLQAADASVAESSRSMVIYTALAVVLVSLVTGIFVWRLVHVRVSALKEGTDRLRRGELGYEIEVQSRDELGELADSFNQMSRQLHEAREEVERWTQMLEARVEDKTRELKLANQQILVSEKMASIGKLAATVAHEINNPLSGILTYAKLLRKWATRTPWNEERREEVCSSLELIESESRRCGEIVKNLLMFSRSAPMNLQWTEVNGVIDRCVRLVQHQLELNNVELTTELESDLPNVYCDPAQIEQLLLALVMNAIEAMPRGGNLRLRSRWMGGEVELQVEDDGPGIPQDLLPHVFEPFFTTKEGGHGVGLGLAISKGVVERHHGTIEVKSAPGKGTRFMIRLPIDVNAPAATVVSAGAEKR